MNITLEANPSDAPCCVKVIAENGKNLLIQTDWDYPGIATTFGWSKEDAGPAGNIQDSDACKHEKTDGTVNCPDCGCTASEFIAAARQWIDDNDGAQAEDPGYFNVD